MKITKVALLGLSVFALVACGGGSSRKEADKGEFPAAASSAVALGNPYKSATMTAFYQNTQNGQKAIDETDKKCTYTWTEVGWDVAQNNLGQYTGTFLNAPNTMIATAIESVFQTLISSMGLTSPSDKYYVEGGLAAKLTGKIDASKLARGATGTIDMTLDVSFNANGLIENYDNLNKGTFTYNGANYNYEDHCGFSIAYAA